MKNRVQYRPGLSAEDHQTRSHGVGSSEIGMVLGLSPWGGMHTLWRRKVGIEEFNPDPQQIRQMRRGSQMERAILEIYAEEHDLRVKTPKTIRHPQYPYCVDSADGLVWLNGDDRPSRCCEVKNTHFCNRGEWGEPGTDDIPAMYLVQGLWHMGHWRMPVCDFPVYWGGQVEVYQSKFDEELWLAAVSEAERFWVDFVEPKKEPPMDGHSTTSDWLRSRIDVAKDKKAAIQAEGELLDLMREYRAARVELDCLEPRVEELANRLKAAMLDGDAQAIVVPGSKAKVTFSITRGRERVDTDAIIARLVSMIDGEVDIDAIRAEYTARGADFRTFRPQMLVKHGEGLGENSDA